MITSTNWPPNLDNETLQALVKSAIDWTQVNGLSIQQQTDTGPKIIHAPFALFPSCFSKACFDYIVKIQPLFNTLVDRVSRDNELLSGIIEKIYKDDFIQKLNNIYQKCCKLTNRQTLQMGIHRSDYMIHGQSVAQIEINTIAAGLPSLSVLMANMHKFLAESTDFYKTLHLEYTDWEKTSSLIQVVDTLAAGWSLYRSKDAATDNPVVLMVVQPVEFNIFDQRWIEYKLFEKYKIKMIRKSLIELSKGELVDQRFFVQGYEVAVAYFRAGYSPKDYPTENEWKAREILEISRTIKCPTIAYQLVGTKKMQQELSNPLILQRYFSKDECLLMSKCFAGLYPLDDSINGMESFQIAIEHPEQFVLKPQREGGGNNVYGQAVREKLLSMSAEERSMYILMDLIKPPMQTNYLVSKGKCEKVSTTSELGMYGVWLSDSDVVYINKEAGHLLRTKLASQREGGLAVGTGFLDTPFLI